MDTDSSIIHIKTNDTYDNLADDVENNLMRQVMKLNAIPLIDYYLKVKIKK